MRNITRAAEAVSRVTRWPAIFWLLATAAVAAEPVLQADSRFGFRAVVEGEAFEARFGRFSVTPLLDADRQPVGFTVEVDLNATDSGSVERDAEMRGADWFDVAGHPRARFHGLAVEPAGQGGFVTRGELELKGVTRPLAVPFSWTVRPAGMQMTGQVELDRRWFGVGPADDSSVAAGVTVYFDLLWRGR